MKVEIWSDVVCPWCAIGKRRFEKALAEFAHRDEVQVRWRSFELDPTAPRERPGDLVDHLAEKYGMSRENAHGMERQMSDQAAGEGWDFRLDRARSGNTFDAHRLLHLGAERGVQDDAVQERLLAAYLTGGERIGDPETLVRLGAEVGLDPDEAREVLAGDRYADEVRADERQAHAFGIGAVPFFVIDRTYGVSGAQPAAALLEALETAWAQSHPLTALTPVGAPAVGSCASDLAASKIASSGASVWSEPDGGTTRRDLAAGQHLAGLVGAIVDQPSSSVVVTLRGEPADRRGGGRPGPCPNQSRGAPC